MSNHEGQIVTECWAKHSNKSTNEKNVAQTINKQQELGLWNRDSIVTIYYWLAETLGISHLLDRWTPAWKGQAIENLCCFHFECDFKLNCLVVQVQDLNVE